MATAILEPMAKQRSGRVSSEFIPVVPPDPVPEVAERKRVVRSNRWDPEILDAIADFIADQMVGPSEISVMETGVKFWLKEIGYWPRKNKRKSSNSA